MGCLGLLHGGGLAVRELGAEQSPEMILTIKCMPTYRCILPNVGVELAVVLYASAANRRDTQFQRKLKRTSNRPVTVDHGGGVGVHSDPDSG